MIICPLPVYAEATQINAICFVFNNLNERTIEETVLSFILIDELENRNWKPIITSQWMGICTSHIHTHNPYMTCLESDM